MASAAATPLRIAHCLLARAVPIGVQRQLAVDEAEAAAAGIQLQARAYWPQRPRRCPAWLWRVLEPPAARLGFVRLLLREAPRQRYLLVRYPIADPLLALALLALPHVLLLHHTKERQELKLLPRHRLLALLEALLGGLIRGSAAHVVAVSPYLAQHQARRGRHRRPGLCLPNGMAASDLPDLSQAPAPPSEPLGLLLLASRPEPWHGLERIMDLLDGCPDLPLRLHLVGDYPPSNDARVERHGRLDAAAIAALARRCHGALGAQRLDLLHLPQSSTLKVVHCLALGLPIAVGHREAAFPVDFPWIARLDEDPQTLRHFLERCRQAEPREVQLAARSWLLKRYAWARLARRLPGGFTRGSHP